MKAITFSAHGGTDVLAYEQIDLPVAGPGEALVRIHAAGVNPVDIAVREGLLEAMVATRFPAVPGWDLAGVVEAVGDGVTGFRPGDLVWGFARRDVVQQGTYAHFVAAEVTSIGIRPRTADVLVAGALPLVALTALQALRSVGVGRGDTVLVHGAAGGVGHVAVQVAKALGAARVIGTAGLDDHDFVRRLGAEALEYGPGLPSLLRALAPRGVDAALDTHGSQALDQSFSLVHDAARVVSIVDTAVRGRGGQYVSCRPSRADLDQLAAWVDAGQLRAELAEAVPLAEAARAQELVASGHTRGKVVLQM